jgi:hypothetical protein
MTRLEYEIDIAGRSKRCFNICAGAQDVKDSCPNDLVKDSKTNSGIDGEKGSSTFTIKLEGELEGRRPDETQMMVSESWLHNSGAYPLLEPSMACLKRKVPVFWDVMPWSATTQYP